MEEVITKEQFQKLLKCLLDESRECTFRYLIYDVMGFKPEDYAWLYSTGLLTLKENLYDLRAEIKNLRKIILSL